MLCYKRLSELLFTDSKNLSIMSHPVEPIDSHLARQKDFSFRKTVPACSVIARKFVLLHQYDKQTQILTFQGSRQAQIEQSC